MVSHQTGKPRPLTMISPIVVKLISGFVKNGAKDDVPTMSIPALQNAETAWNTEYQMPFRTPYSGIKYRE